MWVVKGISAWFFFFLFSIFLLLPKQLNEEITRYNLADLAKRLRDTANEIPAEMSEVRTSLRNQALHLATYQENLVDPMTRDTREMMQLTTKLDESFKFNSSTFEKGIENILNEIEEAKKFIEDKATTFVQKVSEFEHTKRCVWMGKDPL